MLDTNDLSKLREQIAEVVKSDRRLLDELVNEVRPLAGKEQRINPRSATSVALVGTDGGNNQLKFDPFLVQLVRIVDSSDNELWLEVVGPSTPIRDLDAVHLDAHGNPSSPLGKMMVALGVRSLEKLSPMLRDPPDGSPRSPSWTQVYRELNEWAVLLELVQKPYGTDTLIVFDGFIRSKVFKGTLFADYGRLLDEHVAKQRAQKRDVIVVGVAKHSKVLTRYRLALKLLGILRGRFPAFLEVPRELEERAYVWSEYARGREDQAEGGEASKFVNGKMFFVKFGDRPHDTIWPVDILESQVSLAPKAFGYLVKDAQDGFPVPLYPRCLQKAHEAAALVGFDMDILQDVIINGVRDVLNDDAPVLDEFLLEPADPSTARY